jgi:hypothetical protein
MSCNLAAQRATVPLGAVVLEGEVVIARLKTCRGGEAAAETIAVAGQPGRKTIGQVRFEPLVLEADLAPFLPWVQQLVAGQGRPLSFAVARVDANNKVVSKLQVLHAQITKVEIDELNAADTAQLQVRITLQPDRSEEGKAGDTLATPAPATPAMQRSNFAAALGGTDLPQAIKVGPIVITAKAASVAIGSARQPQVTAATLELTNLKLTVAERGVAPFVEWHKSFVIDGKTGPAQEKVLALRLLAQDMKTVLLRLEARGCGVLAVRRTFAVNDSQAAREAELYVTQWAINP